MAVTKIADMQHDFDHWKETRRGYLSSSEMFSWLDKTPDWWQDGPESVLQNKQGVERVFDKETETTIAHGTYDEANILEKFGHAVGCDVRNENGFWVNDAFPGIGASVDGFGRPASMDPDCYPEFSQDRDLFPRLRELIDTRSTNFITEVKKSLSVKWQKEVPEYYLQQVKTQLSVLEMNYAIIIAETTKKGEKQKWRQFWDMRAYVIEYDPTWDDVLKREGEKFLTAAQQCATL